jgi:hypothetical protein
MHGIVLTSVQETFTFPDGRRLTLSANIPYNIAAVHLNYCREDEHNWRRNVQWKVKNLEKRSDMFKGQDILDAGRE